MRYLLLLLLLVASVARADVEITSLPYSATTDSERYYLSGSLTWASGTGITLGCSSCELDMQGFSITSTNGAAAVGISVPSGETAVVISEAIVAGARVLIDSPTTIDSLEIREYAYNDEGAIRFSANADGSTLTHSKIHKGDAGGTSRPAIYLRTGCTNVRIEDCLLIGDGSSVIQVDDGCTGTEIVGCAIDGSDGGLSAVNVSLSSGAFTYANNIARSSNGVRVLNFTDAGYASATTANNRYWGGTDLVRYQGTNYGSGTITTFEATALVGDPLWENDNQTLAGDYSLGDGSTSVDAGDSTYTETTLDLAEQDRIQGAQVDQGAYEGAPPPPVDVGACCLSGRSSCEVLTEAECTAASGEYQGDSTDCDPNPCVGACCYDEECIVQPEAECAGTYDGDGTDCSPNPCDSDSDCDFLITETGSTYTITDAGTYCVDGGADNIFTWSGGGNMVFVDGPITGSVLIKPAGGQYQDTLQATAGGQFFEVEDGSGTTVTIDGFCSRGARPSLWAEIDGENTTMRNIKANGRIIGQASGNHGASMTGLVFENVSIEMGSSGTNAPFDFAGRINTAGGGQVFDVPIDGATVRNLYIDATMNNDQTCFKLFGWHNMAVDDVTIRMHAPVETNGCQPVKFEGCDGGYADSVTVYATGNPSWIALRGTTDSPGVPRDSTEDMTFSNWTVHSVDYGINMDTHRCRLENARVFIEGTSNNTYALRTSEEATADTLVNSLFVNNGSNAWNADETPGPILVQNSTFISRAAYSLGSEDASTIKLDDNTETITMRECIIEQETTNSYCISMQDGWDGPLTLENCALRSDGQYLVINNRAGTRYATIAELEGAGFGSGNQEHTGGPITDNPAPVDSTGTYSISGESIAIDMGDSTNALSALDIAGRDRVRGANLDAGAWESQFTGLTGACCSVAGECSILIEADCTGIGGTYQGNGTDCDPDPCEELVGACCVGGTDCYEITEAACGDSLGQWYGAGIMCDDLGVGCSDLGACCVNGGDICLDGVSEASCTAAGGEWWGQQTCAEIACTPATGACCVGPDCTIETAEDCDLAGGAYQGHDVPCTPSPCEVEDPTGACCLSNGLCQVSTEAVCDGANGEYQGDDSDCDPNPCAAPLGACCAAETNLCTMETQEDCDAAGGGWYGPTYDCDPAPCPPGVGACCLMDVEPPAECILTLDVYCDQVGGIFQGIGTGCDPDPCTGYLLLVGTERVIGGNTTSLWNQAPSSAMYADTTVDVVSVGPWQRHMVIRFDLAQPIPGTIVDAWIDVVLHSEAHVGGDAASQAYTRRVLRDVVIEEATWYEYASGSDWSGEGGPVIGVDISDQMLSEVDITDHSPGQTVRLVGGHRADNLVRSYLVPQGWVAIHTQVEAGSMEILGAGSSAPPELTIVYVASSDGRRRALRILGSRW